MNLKYLLLFLISFFLFSCQQESNSSLQHRHFFDLKDYFKNEQARLTKINKVIKKANIDGKLEEKTLEGVNFKEELALFADSDINKISWLDKYDADTTRQGNDIVQINYLAKDKNLKTNSLSIFYQNNKVNQINIIRKTSSIAAELEQELIYKPSSGYSIKSLQQTSLSDPHVLELDVQFVQ